MPEADLRSEPPGKALLQLREVGKNYGSRVVLQGVDLEIRAGQVIGLIGPNGAGKTTLLRLAMGLLRPASGVVSLDGAPPARGLASCPVAFFGGAATVPPYVGSRCWFRIASGGKDGLPESRRVRSLSRGNRQILGLRAALARPGVRMVFLDEPWEGLDPDAARWLTGELRSLRDRGAAAVISSHRMHDLAGACDEYAFLIRGRLQFRSARSLAPGRDVTGEDLYAAFDRLSGRPVDA